MNICFSNNATNTNTQQSPPLANIWLKQIKANLLNKQRDTKHHFSKSMNANVRSEVDKIVTKMGGFDL